jgi:hypothetical protein
VHRHLRQQLAVEKNSFKGECEQKAPAINFAGLFYFAIFKVWIAILINKPYKNAPDENRGHKPKNQTLYSQLSCAT